MAARLRARGDSWGEFVELLAHFKLDEEDRKRAEKAKHQKPILPPPNMVRKAKPEATTDARHDVPPAGDHRDRRGRPA